MAGLVLFDWPLWVLVVVMVVLFVPGRVQGHYCREFFRGLRLQAEARWEQALKEYERFLSRLRRQPWIKKLISFNALYTRDLEAMTHNNMGGCHLELGRFDDAEREFRIAQELDDEYPLPHYNLAIASELRGDRDAAERHLLSAERLGYKRTTIDQLAHKAAEYFARVEGGFPRAR